MKIVLDLKVVIDTNVFVSGVFFSGPPYQILKCVLASESRTIISGDKHLLKVSGYKDIEVLKPRDFVDKYLV
jgi:predicted nucleic acid-binding protein